MSAGAPLAVGPFPQSGDQIVGTSIVFLGSTPLIYKVLDVQADAGNMDTILVGIQGGPNIALPPGYGWTFYDVAPNNLWCSSTGTGQLLHWIGHGFHLNTEIRS